MAMMKSMLLVSASVTLGVFGNDAQNDAELYAGRWMQRLMRRGEISKTDEWSAQQRVQKHQKYMDHKQTLMRREKKQTLNAAAHVAQEEAKVDNSWTHWLYNKIVGPMGSSASLNQADVKSGSEQRGQFMEKQGDQDLAHEESDVQEQVYVSHGSAQRELIKWLRDFKGSANHSTKTMKVLDVGGGRADLHQNLRNAWPTGSFEYECLENIDVDRSSECKEFDGRHLHSFASDSKDLVVVKYVMQDPTDTETNRIHNLLREAGRVSSNQTVGGRVVLWEDVGPESDFDAKRRKKGREKILGKMGFHVEQSMQSAWEPKKSGDDIRKRLGRRMWILTFDKRTLPKRHRKAIMKTISS